MSVQALDIKVLGHHTRVYMSGPERAKKVLLLLHDGAWGGSAMLSWDRVIQHLPSDTRVVAPDMLGFGQSDKAFVFGESHYNYRIRHIAALLQTLCIDQPVHCVGTSFGGSMVFRAAVARELNMASGTSISGTGGPGRTELSRQVLGNFEPGKNYIRKVVELITNSASGMETQCERRYQLSLIPGHYECMMAPRLSISDRGANTADEYPAVLRKAIAPLHFVRMLADPLVSSEWHDLFDDSLDHIHVHRMDGPHSPNLTQAKEVATLIKQIIKN